MQMQSYGIRQTKAHLSELVRDASTGQCSLVTDNGKLVAMIGPPPVAPVAAEAAPDPATTALPSTTAAAFRDAILTVPHPLDLDF